MIFTCPHGNRQGVRCWLCGGLVIVATVVDFTDDDILQFVPKRLHEIARHSLLDRMSHESKMKLIMSLTR